MLHFISACRNMIRYPEFRERGWQIGSGSSVGVKSVGRN
jgi:hypothetical protein